MIKPLTKVSKDGEVYSRPQEVVENIASALGLGLDAIRARLKEDDANADGYLKSECLVYLFREARDKGDDAMFNLIATALLSRCETILLSKRSNTSVRLHDDILAEFACLLANESSQQLDYYECRFNRAFRMHRLEMVRKEAKRCKKVETRAFGSSTSDADDEETHADEPACRSRESDDLARRELLDQLPPDLRKAVVLCEMGYPIESKDPSKDTVATLCGVSERTIHNWLKRAKVILPNPTKEST